MTIEMISYKMTIDKTQGFVDNMYNRINIVGAVVGLFIDYCLITEDLHNKRII